MSKKSVYSIVLVVVLIGVLGVFFNVHKVEAPYPIIFIRTDGSIDPPTANITSPDNVTYTFTADINASIIVEKDNIIVDGAGYTLQGTGSGRGIDLTGRSNVTIKNMTIKGFYQGILLSSYSPNNTISGNAITTNEFGIYFDSSSNNTISGNNITNNMDGIWLYKSSNITISGNGITNTDYTSIYLEGPSSNNIISANSITENNGTGIVLDSSSNNNTISGNNITNNEYGIVLLVSSSNTISGNSITNNDWCIYFDRSSNNRFYHNNIIDNTQQVDIEASGYANFWDDGVEGNYWSNYTGVDLNHDGIGDSPHIIDGNNTDNYPLMGMFHSFNTPLGYQVNVISNSTIEDFTFFESNSTIIMHVSNMTTNQTCGFCRIRIPHALMNETYHVTIDGAEPDYVNYTLHDDEDNRWIYFSYQHSTLEIVIIPEFPSFLILPLFMIATLLAVIVYRRQLKKRKSH